MKLKIKPYPPNILKLQEIEGFINAFYINCRKESTYKAAYYKTEMDYYYYYKRNRFSGYDSFRVSLANYLKSK